MAVRAIEGGQAFKQRLAGFAARRPLTAYFCMEYGLWRKGVTPPPIYSGGLGVLAGDTIKSAADIGAPFIGVGLLYRDGFFRQRIVNKRQVCEKQPFDPSQIPNLHDLNDEVSIMIQGRKVNFRLWGYEVAGEGGDFAPLLLLDSLGAPNTPGYESITKQLYVADQWQKLLQEIALGIGGMRALAHYGLDIDYYHLNEGHAAFAPVEWLRTFGKDAQKLTDKDYEAVRRCFSFTTHTPVDAAFDRFHKSQVFSAFEGADNAFLRRMIDDVGSDRDNRDFINMALIAMGLCGVKNGVSVLHAKVSCNMFPNYTPIIPITNGVHHLTWVCDPMAALFSRYQPAWVKSPEKLITLADMKSDSSFRTELWSAHQAAKEVLTEEVQRRTGEQLDRDVFTIGCARRFATYKRSNLLFFDEARLIQLAQEKGSLQILFAGKAHPNDNEGQGILTAVIEAGERLTKMSGGKIKFVFLEDYNEELASMMVSGVDVWLNNPQVNYEASGTSGMKAALNGVPQISTNDGWWVERRGGGWTINEGVQLEYRDDDPKSYQRDSVSLYSVLGQAMDSYYKRATDPTFIYKMIEAIAQNGSYFNTHRMYRQYQGEVWSPERTPSHQPLVEIGHHRLPHTKLLRLASIARGMGRMTSNYEVEDLLARGALQNLPGCAVATRYRVHRDAVKISQRWVKSGNDAVTLGEEAFLRSGFKDWTVLSRFENEVMASLLIDRRTQVVNDPASDRRCYRDDRLVADTPFIIVPEIVRGKITGAYKYDFRKGLELGRSFEVEFLETLVGEASRQKEDLLDAQLNADLSATDNETVLTNWFLTLLTAGGFAEMPGYALETNRAAFFGNTTEGLVGVLAAGDLTKEEHSSSLGSMMKDMFSSGVESYLKRLDRSQWPLSRHIAGKNLGNNAVLGTILFEGGIPIYDLKEFGDFDARALSAQKAALEQLFACCGRPPEHYLLVPVKDNNGKILGIIYVDNIFTGSPIDPVHYKAEAAVFGRHLARLRAAAK